MPDKIPHFVGRQEECGAVLNHLTNGDTRLVDIWGPPGFGKTSLAINVAHHLREMKIPVYFTSLRGMKSNDELVSKLLSIFTDAKQAFYVSPSHWLIQSLQQLEETFVLILDNADDLLESGDSKVKDDFLRFTEEIFAHCSHIKLLFTTRERLDCLSHKLPIHQERVGVLDEVSSVSLVEQSLSKPMSDNDCNRIVNVCGRVPLAMRLMCGIMKEESVSLSELLEELKASPLVEVLDNESLPDDIRLKIIINRSFERLTGQEKDAFVSLAVFPNFFGVQEAKAVLDLTARLTKKVLHSLKRKSLIDCSDDFESCTIHSLLQSFIDERRTANDAIQTIFNAAQLRFYDYHISSFGVANENFLTGHSNDAFQVFVRQRESILISLENGAKEDALYPKVVKVLSKAELFFHALLPNGDLLVENIYSTTEREAKKRQRRDDECNLAAAKSFRSLGGFYVDRQDLDHSLQAGILDTDSCTAKRLCYLGIHQLLSGKTDDGISSLRASVGRLSSDYDEKVLKVLAYHVLAVYYRKKGDTENSSEFQTFCSNECKSPSLSPTVRNLFSSVGNVTDLDSIDVEHDVFFFVVGAELLSGLYWELEFGKQTEMERSTMTHHLVGLHKVPLKLFDKGIVRIRVLQACCKALYCLKCFKEAAEGFQMITNELEMTQRRELKRTAENYLFRGLAENYLFRGLALNEMKDYEEASFCLTKSLDIRRQLLQENEDATHGDKMVREVIDSLQHCLTMQRTRDGAKTGDTDDLKVVFEELKSVLKSMEKTDDADHAEIASNYNQLGYCYFLMDDFNAALESYEQAIKITEEHEDYTDGKVTFLISKGNACLEMNRNSEAGEAYQSALEKRKLLGIEDHADTAVIYDALGANHFVLGEFSEALDACHKSLQIRKKHLGDHTITAQSLSATGHVYFKIGRYEAAIEHFQHAADLAKSLLGDHEETACKFDQLAAAYLKMEKYRGALDAYHEARNIRLKVLGEHLDTAISFHQCGYTCFKMGNFKEAARSFRKASEMRFNFLGDHLDTALSWHCLGEAQLCKGDFSGALESLHEALRIRDKELGIHSETAATSELLGRAYGGLGQHESACQQIRRTLKMREYLQTDGNTALSDPSNPFLGCNSEGEYLSMISPNVPRV